MDVIHAEVKKIVLILLKIANKQLLEGKTTECGIIIATLISIRSTMICYDHEDVWKAIIIEIDKDHTEYREILSIIKER